MSSPPAKRIRLSSPDYEGGIEALGVDDLEELDRIELSLSQQKQQQQQHGHQPFTNSTCKLPQSSQMLSQDAKQRRLRIIEDALRCVTDSNAFDYPEAMGEKRFRDNGLAPALSNNPVCELAQERSSSSERAQFQKDDSKSVGLVSDSDISLPGFQVLSKSVLALSSDDPIDVASVSGFTSADQSFAGLGFSTAANIRGSVLEPSKEALELAAKKLETWAGEDESAEEIIESSRSPSKPGSGKNAFRPVLATVSNSPSIDHARSPKPRSFSSPLINRTAVTKPRGFKSPLIGQPSSRVYPKGRTAGASPNKSWTVALRNGPPDSLGSTSVSSPQIPDRAVSDNSLQFSTPSRPTASSNNGHVPKNTFSTPFKEGMKLGQPGRAELDKRQAQGKMPENVQKASSKHSTISKTAKTGKIMLKNSGLKPQQYTTEELEDMGLNITELRQITPQTAVYYAFHSDASATTSAGLPIASSSSYVSLGPAQALAHLQKTGRITTRTWVDNHWALILWKLAGLVALDPAREATQSRRWCWRAVLCELEARHDREFGKGARPALRLITIGDAPAASPLVLVVTAILSSEEQKSGPNCRVVEDASAKIEVSDGWYRLRASLDAPLARAVVRGIIRPGRKIAVAGSKLDNLRKDPCEILDAYESCTLLLFGNGSHLAPWHARLGFQAEPFTATLESLTCDGGLVPLVDFVVEKVHPIAFFEFIPGDKSGEKTREGPRSESEESAIEDAWRRRRDAAESKAREELNARWNRWEGFAERLERAAGGRFKPSEEDMPPDQIEDLFDELDALAPADVGAFIRQLEPVECVWLARHLLRRSERDRELAPEEIELEMNHVCPPREVRNFRIVQVRDARTARRPANRVAHLCIWDVLSLCVSEGGKAGAIESGQRFLMTSLVPMHKSCWMGRAKDDMVYLSTTRNSRFTRLK